MAYQFQFSQLENKSNNFFVIVIRHMSGATIYITKIICVCVSVRHTLYLRNPLTYDHEILYA